MNASTTSAAQPQHPCSTAATVLGRWRARSNHVLATVRAVARDTRQPLKATPWQKLFAPTLAPA